MGQHVSADDGWWRGQPERLKEFNEEDHLDFLEIQIGDAARTFFHSPFGDLVVKNNLREWRDARNALESVSAADTAEIQELQLRARVARGIIQQIADAIDHGVIAEARQRAIDQTVEDEDA